MQRQDLRIMIAGSFVILLVALTHSVQAARPFLSDTELLSSASCVVTGKVVTLKTDYENSGDWRYYAHVIEIVVSKVEKGRDIAVGDRIFVRCSNKKWRRF